MGGIPSNYTVDVYLDLVSPVELSGIPTTYQINGIPTTYEINIGKLPKLEIALDPITINPMDISLRVTEAPSIRAHVPANFTVGFSLLGFQLACVRLCGEAQVITEPYKPNPCEPCGSAPLPQPLPVPPPPPPPPPPAPKIAAAKPRARARKA